MDWPPGRAAMHLPAFAAVLLLLTIAHGCATTPVFPDPRPDSGQIVVSLEGVPREGVTGPKRETIQADYSSYSESVERGKAFERVRYDALEDVIVMVARRDAGAVYPVPSSVDSRSGPELMLSSRGFVVDGDPCVQHPHEWCGLLQFNVRNWLHEPAELYIEGDRGELRTVSIAPGERAELMLPSGVHVITTDAIDGATCKVFATDQGAVREMRAGRAELFNLLRPGEYEISVYAPRLPVVHQGVTVEAGKRTEFTAELTVNHLPKAGR